MRTVNVPQAQELLMQFADTRMKKYQMRTVDNIPLDELTLRLLGEKTASDKAAAYRFGQLFSYAMELYIKDRAVMGKTQKEQLASVLMQTKARVLPNCSPRRSRHKKSVEKDTDQSLNGRI